MYGRDLGVNSEDLEVMEAVQETKQEVLENKDVSCVKMVLISFSNNFMLIKWNYYVFSGIYHVNVMVHKFGKHLMPLFRSDCTTLTKKCNQILTASDGNTTVFSSIYSIGIPRCFQ